MKKKYEIMDTLEILDRVKIYEKTPSGNISRDEYVEMLEELYNREPEEYFRKWYFFNSFSKADVDDWKDRNNFLIYFDECIAEQTRRELEGD